MKNPRWILGGAIVLLTAFGTLPDPGGEPAAAGTPSPAAAAAGTPSPAPAAAPASDDPFPEARNLIHEAIHQDGIASVAVSVAHRGEFVWEEGFGWADRERRVRATEHTPYSTASISKPVTATAIMLLAERGELDIDRPANDYLAPAGQLRAYEGSADEATVRRILSHTAGLPLHYQFFYEDGGYDPPSADETIRRRGAVVHPPGERYVYSNLGYGVLDRIVERVSGEPFGDFLQREIFTPLGMHRSSLGIRRGLEEHAAARYHTNQDRLPFYDFDHDGASAVYASAHDLVRFGLFHMGTPLEDQREILSGGSREAMQAEETPPGSPRGYGLGWIVTDDHHGYRQFAHSGGMPGVSTQLQVYPDEELVIAVVTNGMPRWAGRVADAIAAGTLPDFDPDEEPVAGSGGGGSDDFDPPPELVGMWEGTVTSYAGEQPVRMEVHDDGDVHIELEEQLETVVNDPRFEDGVFRGTFTGTIEAPDVRRHPHRVAIEATLGDERLAGSATALSETDPIHFALSSRLELSREGDGSGDR